MKRLALCWLFVLSGCAFAFAPQDASSKLEVSVDPRIELLATVQVLSGSGERGRINDYDFAYRRNIEEYFADHKDHPVVQTFSWMEQRGFSYDAPPTAMLHLSDPPGLKVTTPFTGYLALRGGGRQQLEDFISELRDFATETDFMTFYRANRGSLQHMVQRVSEKTRKTDYVTVLEDYYGTEQHGYHVVLAPLFRGSYGPRLRRPDGTHNIYSIIEPTGLKDGVPLFSTGENLRYLVWHEFGHSFVNPLATEHITEIEKYSSLFKPLADRMKKQAYGTWKICVNEHIVRAVHVRLTRRKVGKAAAESMLQREKARGFAYVPALCERLEEYEANRDKYPTFKSFYPRLINVFKTLSEKDLGDDFYRPALPNINSALSNSEGGLIVVPTNESSAEVQRRIHAYARAIRDRFFKNRQIITDNEALERDLSSNLVIAYGTHSGNRWLARHIDELPVRIEADQIVADKAYEGTNLRFITAWPNPDNPERPVVIYTAQRAKDIVKINAVFHGPTNYVVARGQQVLHAGNYVRQDGKLAFE